MGDRIDEQVGREWAQEQRAEREADLKIVGPLFCGVTRELVEFKIADATRLPKDEVKDIVDTIDHLAGEKGANAKQIIKYAIADHINKPAFVNHLAGELEDVVKSAVAEREDRIAALHAPARQSVFAKTAPK